MLLVVFTLVTRRIIHNSRCLPGLPIQVRILGGTTHIARPVSFAE